MAKCIQNIVAAVVVVATAACAMRLEVYWNYIKFLLKYTYIELCIVTKAHMENEKTKKFI